MSTTTDTAHATSASTDGTDLYRDMVRFVADDKRTQGLKKEWREVLLNPNCMVLIPTQDGCSDRVWERGENAVLRGLVSQPGLNGKRVRVLDSADATTGRIPIRVDSEERDIAVRPSCLKTMHASYKLALPFDVHNRGTGPTPVTQRVFMPAVIVPRPSHNEYCPVCTDTTRFQTPNSTAYEFPCRHVVCWKCVSSFAGKITSCGELGLPCPICHKRSHPGRYYDVAGVALMHFDMYSIRNPSQQSNSVCTIASSTPPPQLHVLTCIVEIVRDDACNWNSMYAEHDRERSIMDDTMQRFECAFPGTIDLMQEQFKPRCFVCGLADGVKKCPCHATWYCSTLCQRMHFKAHSRECKTLIAHFWKR